MQIKGHFLGCSGTRIEHFTMSNTLKLELNLIGEEIMKISIILAAVTLFGYTAMAESQFITGRIHDVDISIVYDSTSPEASITTAKIGTLKGLRDKDKISASYIRNDTGVLYDYQILLAPGFEGNTYYDTHSRQKIDCVRNVKRIVIENGVPYCLQEK
jgi:hypothetical protein